VVKITDGYNATYDADDATESGQDLIISFLVKLVPWVGLILLILIVGYFRKKMKGLVK